MEHIATYVQEIVLDHPLLREFQSEIGFALGGSRVAGYDVPWSDYDFLCVCEDGVFRRIAESAGKRCDGAVIEIPVDREAVRTNLGVEIDIAVWNLDRTAQAIRGYNDVIIWIWSKAKGIADPAGHVAFLQSQFRGYPRDVLERKLKKHFLRDFHLSVHGITYHPGSENVFSVVHALVGKVAEFCRICCLLDGKSFPYEKWLLKECEMTAIGQKISPLLRKVITNITGLDGDLVKNAGVLKETVRVLDEEACDILDGALVAWGIEKEWLEGAYDYVDTVLFEEL